MKMKTIRNLAFLVVLTGIVFTSCKKNDDSNPENPISNGSMSLKHDGTSWSATLAVQGVNSNGVINVTGSDSNGNQASVIIYGTSGPGTYKIGGFGNASSQGRWTQGLGQNDTYVANAILGEGEVQFDELSETSAKGSFSFVGYNTDQDKVTVTEGSFNVTF